MLESLLTRECTTLKSLSLEREGYTVTSVCVLFPQLVQKLQTDLASELGAFQVVILDMDQSGSLGHVVGGCISFHQILWMDSCWTLK